MSAVGDMTSKAGPSTVIWNTISNKTWNKPYTQTIKGPSVVSEIHTTGHSAMLAEEVLAERYLVLDNSTTSYSYNVQHQNANISNHESYIGETMSYFSM